MSSSPLPKFGNSPVVEVALSILFEPLERFRSAHAGRLWERIKDRFPTTEDQHELPYAIEEMTAPAPPPRLELMDRPRSRTWFQSADGTQLFAGAVQPGGVQLEAGTRFTAVSELQRGRATLPRPVTDLG